ncbi:MAG: Rpn family recombination-promoting nuclease/putative transposase [Pseudohongiellaceae bacterium]
MSEAEKSAKLHDALNKELFSNRKLTAVFLHEHLPPEVTARFRKGALPELVDSNFVEPDARQIQADVLCRVRLKSGAADHHYFLIEHKSWPDHGTLAQLCRYQLGIWDRHIKKGAGGKRALPPVTPLVIYHGKKPWNVPRSFRGMVKNEDAIPYSGLDLSYQLVDLTNIPHDDLSGNKELWAGLAALRGLGRQKEGKANMIDIIKALSTNEGLENSVFRYIVSTWELSNEERNQLINATKRGGIIMNSFVEELKAEIKAEAKAEAEAEVKAEAKAEAKAESEVKTLKRQVQVRFGSVPQDVEVRIDQASPEEIEGWVDQILVATSLEEMFASPSSR